MNALALDARSLVVFFGLSVILGGAASFSAGRALAQGWRPLGLGALYAALIGAAVRFLHYALYQEPLLSAERYGLDVAVAYVFLVAGFVLTRRRMMAQRYGRVLDHDAETLQGIQADVMR